MASWAADCAERVLPFFESVKPDDARPLQAIETCRTWARTGLFDMSVIRGSSLAAHAAAREVQENDAACFAARAAGQAVATAHVLQHSFGASYYALKAVGAFDPLNAARNMVIEQNWQLERAPFELKCEISKHILIETVGRKVHVKILKDYDF